MSGAGSHLAPKHPRLLASGQSHQLPTWQATQIPSSTGLQTGGPVRHSLAGARAEFPRDF